MKDNIKPVSYLSYLLFNLNITKILFPYRCKICGKRVRGNFFKGYKFSCEHDSGVNQY